MTCNCLFCQNSKNRRKQSPYYNEIRQRLDSIERKSKENRRKREEKYQTTLKLLGLSRNEND